jgi:glutathione synthase/RimK-type ligase-like ATP-grasp enzyme
MKSKILIVIDYRKQFWLRADYKESNFNLPLLISEFNNLGYQVDVSGFSQLDLKNASYSDTYVIYQSTEDPDSFYKSFIEDCLLGLELKGAILIPGFRFFRAHNNKVFMEILRDVNISKELKRPQSRYFGTYEEYQKYFTFKDSFPKVFKLSEGAQSKNVLLLKTKKDFLRVPKIKTRTFNLYFWLVDLIKPILKKKYPNYQKKSNHRRKFIIQNFVEGLDGDYKVLVYGNDYYVLSRKVRPNDFRASGSGLLEYKRELPSGLLEYAKTCFNAFDVPFMGLDIAEKEGTYYLIEFQFVHFGNYTLEKSSFHFQFNDNKWNIIEEQVILEKEFANAIHNYIKMKRT